MLSTTWVSIYAYQKKRNVFLLDSDILKADKKNTTGKKGEGRDRGNSLLEEFIARRHERKRSTKAMIIFITRNQNGLNYREREADKTAIKRINSRSVQRNF